MSIDRLDPVMEWTASPPEDRMLTVDELAQQFGVSTKTVRRWSRYGLVSRQCVLDGRRRVGFLQSAVDRFVIHNEKRIYRGARFSRMTDEERKGIIVRVRSLAQTGGGLKEITGRIAQETGRSVETIRHTLKCFETDLSDLAILPSSRCPLPIETKKEIYGQYRRGVSAAALAQQFGQTKRRIYHVINDLNAAWITELPLDCIGGEQFARPCSEEQEREILGALPEGDPLAKPPRAPSSLPAYVAGLYDVPLLTREQESHLFRKMNYLKYKAGMLRAQLDLSRPTSRLMRQIEKLYDELTATKTKIVSANLRLVVSVAKRYVRPTKDFFELVSDGNMSLLRAVEKFDYSRGNKFSTYASWAIIKNFIRGFQDANRHNDRFNTNHSEIFSYTEDPRVDQFDLESAQIQRESQVKSILGRLDERERQIVTARFGLIRGRQPLTLTQVGTEMGVSKERIRQLQSRAMSTLRAAAKESRIECTV
jgi:RNA polymerase primary sigma factor